MDDYKELIERLRELYVTNGTNYVTWAADAIAALVEERDRLREELAAGDKAFHEECDITAGLREELAAAKRDAKRYRWLRENQLCEISDYGDIGLRFNCDFENYNNIDAAIDAAMQENRDE